MQMKKIVFRYEKNLKKILSMKTKKLYSDMKKILQDKKNYSKKSLILEENIRKI